MNLINKKLNIDNLIIIFFSIYPIAILIGNYAINLFIIIIGSFFFFKIIRKKGNLVINKKVFFLLSFFFVSLCINLFFSNNIHLSYQRVIKIFFIIFFVLSFDYIVKNYFQNLNNIFKVWSIVFLIVIFDLFIEFLIGNNLLGQKSIMQGRLGSFTGEESVIGGFFFGFCLIFLSYIYKKKLNIKLNIFIAVTLIIISFLIGERANFIKTLLGIIIYIFLVYRVSLKIKFFSFIIIICLIYPIFSSLNDDFKWRYTQDIKLILNENGLKNYLDNSNYGAHRNVAKEIFLDNPIFGVGIKNFRVESGKEKYDNLDHKYNDRRISNHPHELYYEFLSETGIFGLACFLIFIISSIFISLKNYIKEKNIYQLSSIIFICISILPIIPTGAFLSTMTSSIFWINYAIMIGYNKIK